MFDAVPVPEPVAVPVALPVGDCEGVAVPEREVEPVLPADAPAVTVAVDDTVIVVEALTVEDPVMDAVGVALTVVVPVSVTLALGMPDAPGDAAWLPVPGLKGVLDDVKVGEALRVGLPLGVGVAVLGVAVTEGVNVGEGVGEEGAVGLCVPPAVAEGEDAGVEGAVALCETYVVPDNVPVGDCEGGGAALAVGESEPLLVGDGTGVADAGAEALGALDAEGAVDAGAEELGAPLALAAGGGEGAALADCELLRSCGSKALPPVQRKAYVQGTGKAAPPPHHAPALQTTPEALVEPAGHHAPGGAAHGPLHVALEFKPEVLPKVPAGQG